MSGPCIYRSKARLSFGSLESQLSGGLQVEGPIVILVLGGRPDCYFGPWREGPIIIWVLGEPAPRGSKGQRPRCHLGPWSVRPLGLQVQGPTVLWVLEVSDPWVYRSKARLSIWSSECSSPGLQVDGAIIKVSDADGAGRPSRAGGGT